MKKYLLFASLTLVAFSGWWYMGAILGRQSYDSGRSRILVYGSMVQKLLNDSIDANMIIIGLTMNLLITNCNISGVRYFTFFCIFVESL